LSFGFQHLYYLFTRNYRVEHSLETYIVVHLSHFVSLCNTFKYFNYIAMPMTYSKLIIFFGTYKTDDIM